jgi:peptidoglycan-N-acetylglucosamine deacetylase
MGKKISIAFLVLLVFCLAGKIFLLWSIVFFILVLVLFLALKFYGSFFIDSNFYIQTHCKGTPESNAIALTFDDGPVAKNTLHILEILKSKNVKASFFCIGKNIEANQSVLKQIHSEGHLIGNHTYNHGRLFDLLSANAVADELKKTDELVEKIIHRRPTFFRPPYGVTNPNIAKAVAKYVYHTIGWSVRSFDTVIKDKDKLFQRVTKNLKAGDVVLFHDYCENTIQILPKFIDHVASRGLKIVRLDVLLNVEPYA